MRIDRERIEIMKTWTSWYSNLKFQKKILVICLLVSMIPTFILGIFCTAQSRRMLYEKEETYMDNILQSADQSLNQFLNLYENTITSLVWDDAIQNALNKEYTNNYDRFLAKQEVFEVRIPIVAAINKDVTKTTIYTNTNMYPYSNRIASLQEIQSESWYEQAIATTNPFFVRQQGSEDILVICKIPLKQYTNIIVITLSGEDFFNRYESLCEGGYAVGIYDDEGQLFFRCSKINEEYDEQLYFCPKLERLKEIIDTSMFSVKETNKNEFGWTIMIFRPYYEIVASVNNIFWGVGATIFICIFVVIFVSMNLSRYVVNPLENLTENLNHIEADNFQVTVKSKYNDEIADLIHAFSAMAKRLQKTIDELYVNRIMKQEYRLQMLQSQINPHFLYNCLSMISGKAIRCEQPEIAKTAQSLSAFYRTTLNKGHSKISVENEWKNAMAYLELQKIMHAYSFETECWIDEELFSYQCINLIIQPLVENAILHGIDLREDETEPGKLIIKGERKEEKLVFSVVDNGCGMEPEMCEKILREETKGYGIMNVDQRIKLYFGEEYGIFYESCLGKGTKAQIYLPLLK